MIVGRMKIFYLGLSTQQRGQIITKCPISIMQHLIRKRGMCHYKNWIEAKLDVNFHFTHRPRRLKKNIKINTITQNKHIRKE